MVHLQYNNDILINDFQCISLKSILPKQICILKFFDVSNQSTFYIIQVLSAC